MMKKKNKTERISPGEYDRRYADACVKADVVPAPERRDEDGEDGSGAEGSGEAHARRAKDHQTTRHVS
jgi:hypothetical protein